jgi:hypothetical protein
MKPGNLFYATKNEIGGIALMSIRALEKRIMVLKLRAKIIMAEASRTAGDPAVSLDDARKRLDKKYHIADGASEYGKLLIP